MAEHLIPVAIRINAAGWIFVTTILISSAVRAQSDPTRPPDTSTSESEAANIVTTAPVVKSILISDRRTEALIGDRLVHMGTKIGNAQVVRISESEVVLRDENGLHALKLFPGIEKRIIVAGENMPTGAGRNSKEKRKK